MNSVLKKYYIAMAIMFIPYIFCLFITCYRTNYSITTPGGVSNVDYRFRVDTAYPTNKSLYSLYVYSSENTTIFQNLIADNTDLFEKSEIQDYFSHMTDSLWHKAGVIQKEQSQEASVINAYKEASKINSDIKVDYSFIGVIISITTDTNEVFEIGDIITHVNNIKILNKTHYLEMFRNSDEYTTFTLIRNNETITLDAKGDMGHNSYEKYKINSTTPSYTIKQTSSTGPSAGMMQTLSIYNQLTNIDLTTKDDVIRRIAGTGTMEFDGTIGAIGGVKQKVYSAFHSGADILLVPSANYEEALEMYNTFRNKERMILKECNTIEEVISWLL